MSVLKRFSSLIAVACLAWALALFGCVPSYDPAPYLGEWELDSGSTENLDEKSIEFAESLGSTVLLTLDEEGTGTLDLYGDITTLDWEVVDEESATITVEGSSLAYMVVEDDVLTIQDDDGQTLTFSRP